MKIILILGILLLIIAAYKFFESKQKTSQGDEPNNPLGAAKVSAEEYEHRVVEVACRAALADGVVEDKEVAIICGIAVGFIPGVVDPTQVRAMVDKIAQGSDKEDFLDLGYGLDEIQRQQLLRLALQVIGKEGLAAGGADDFLDKLSMGLLITKEQRDAIAVALPDTPKPSA